MTTSHITHFINADVDHWEGDGQYACALWVKNGETWDKVDTYLDPYDGIEPLARMEGIGLLEMFGKMTNMEDESDVFRVRVLFTLEGMNTAVGVQRQGETDLFINTDEAEGQFVDFTNAVLGLVGA